MTQVQSNEICIPLLVFHERFPQQGCGAVTFLVGSGSGSGSGQHSGSGLPLRPRSKTVRAAPAPAPMIESPLSLNQQSDFQNAKVKIWLLTDLPVSLNATLNECL